MNPFALPSNVGGYPASNYARSALPAPVAPQSGNNTGAGLPAVSRRNIAIGAAVFIVAAYALFHWHFNLD